ncbi:hypothetical protein N2152v2_003230 [Parachlorella kessleri]
MALRTLFGVRRLGGKAAHQVRGVATASLPDLPYDYGALQPVIIPEIMEAMEQYQEAEHKGDVTKMISLQPAIKFNGGGHINHTMFWQMLCPPKDYEPPSGKLEQEIQAAFGSLDLLVTKFNTVAGAIQGSGWGWLGYNKDLKTLQIATTANQDPLQGTTGLVPIVGIDAWEHAFYLQYKNARPDYLKEVWKVVNWADASRRFEEATKAHVA